MRLFDAYAKMDEVPRNSQSLGCFANNPSLA